MAGVKPSAASAATITALHARLSPQSAIVVQTTNNAKTNGARLIAAYASACSLLPNGAALATDNRACVIIPPGKYDLDHGVDDACVPLELDTEFVDIIGLTTDRALQHIYGTPEATNSGVIVQTANDVHISNLTVEILTEVDIVYGDAQVNWDNTDSAAYFPNDNFTLTIVENCAFVGMDLDLNNLPATTPLGSMRWGAIEYSGTFTNCTGGDGAFGAGGEASGDFYNCTGGNHSFGGYGGTASGEFSYCTGEYGAFGAGGEASGIFTNCTGGNHSFGADGEASGIFTNCTGGNYSFGGADGEASGDFYNCTGGNYSFGAGGEASGDFYNCTGGEGSFADEGIVSGTFNNCTVDYGTGFGSAGGTLNGVLSFCKLTESEYKLSRAATVKSVRIAIEGGGTGYEVDDILTVVGGTGTAAELIVTEVEGGNITGISINRPGEYTVLPSNPVAVTDSGNSNATFNLTWNEGHIYGCVDSTGFIAEKNWDD